MKLGGFGFSLAFLVTRYKEDSVTVHYPCLQIVFASLKLTMPLRKSLESSLKPTLSVSLPFEK